MKVLISFGHNNARIIFPEAAEEDLGEEGENRRKKTPGEEAQKRSIIRPGPSYGQDSNSGSGSTLPDLPGESSLQKNVEQPRY